MTTEDRFDRRQDPVGDVPADAGADEGAVTLHEEELRVRTERVATGRVTFRKRVVTEERTVVVTVRREELEILEEDLTRDGAPEVEGDRLDRPGDDGQRGTEPEMSQTPEGDIEIVLYAERPVVTTETVAVERVRVHRGSVVEEQQISAEVSREEAVVERDGDVDGLRDAPRP